MSEYKINNEKYIDALNEIRNGMNCSFGLGINFYYYKFVDDIYYEYVPGKESAKISREDALRKIDSYLRRLKLEKITSTIQSMDSKNTIQSMVSPSNIQK